ncbi:MlaD family protein [Psychroserpens ponticola]|uniref:MlaD family protein n=1 Tax=Psychroserpens ponticola TaxID=2932268 RepID=A0ABY7RXG4_9FLAO|nr:MlaD family protein [Psychroserpens ponticola]WCO00931.1 MlaD family protein [Psychroserpens ponticola]
MKISREVKTAVLVISGILLFVFLFNYLKGENILDSSRTYYVLYDNVEGLAPSTPVTINGMNVGKVKNISFKGDGSGKLLVSLLVDNDFQFSKNSKAELYDLGLIGGKAVAIIPAFDKDANAVTGDYLEARVKAGLTELVNQRLTPLQEKIEVVMEEADSLLVNVNEILDTETKNNIKEGIAELNATIKSFKNTSLSINRLVDTNQESITATLSNFEKTSESFSKLSDSLANANLAGTIKDLQSTIKSFDAVMAGINNGEGSIGKLLKDDALYDNLEAASKEMEELLRDIKLHPARYRRILSKKEIPYKSPTEEELKN